MGLRGSRIDAAVDADQRGWVTWAAAWEDVPSSRDRVRELLARRGLRTHGRARVALALDTLATGDSAARGEAIVQLAWR